MADPVTKASPVTAGASWRASASAGTVAAAVAAILFGTAFVATAVQLRSFDPLPGALWRAALGGAGLLALLQVTSRSRRPADSRSFENSSPLALSNVGRIVVLGLLSGPFFLAGYNVAIGALGATIGGFVVGLYAVLAAVLGPIVARERLGRWAMIGFLAALVGTALLSELRLDRLPATGIGAGIVAAGSYAMYIVLGRRWSGAHGLKPELVALSSAGLTVVLLLGWLLLTAPGTILPATLPPEVLLALIWLAVVLVAGQTLVMTSVKRVTAQRSAAFLLLNPLTSAVLAAALLGERLTPSQVAGALLVLLGIAAATRAWQVIPSFGSAG